MGLRIDIITLNTFLGLFIFLLAIPSKKIQKKWFRGTVVTLWYLVLVVIIIFSFGDVFYFGFVNRHVTKEVVALQNDIHYIIKYEMFGRYLPYTLITFLLLAIYYIPFLKIALKPVKLPEKFATRSLYTILLLAFIIIGIRGKITGRPFQIVDAFFDNKASTGNLALNGFYTFYRTSFFKENEQKRSYRHIDEAIKYVREKLKSERTEFISEKYPLERRFTSFTSVITGSSHRKYNVIIILLESFCAKYIDSFNDGVGAKFHVTPNFDKLASEGISFTNFYANGVRSLDGILAIFTGLVRPFGFDYIGFGLELSNMSYIGRIAKANGYKTIAMQSSKRDSFKIGSTAKMAGFDQVYGAEDMKKTGDEQGYPTFGIWDRYMYDLMIKKINETGEPFLAFGFTSATHSPFKSPGKKWEKYPHNDNSVLGYLNTLYYADWAIGHFIREAKKYPWFKRTIFFFVADHAIPLSDKPLRKMGFNIKDRPLEFMRIPLIIYAPYLLKPQKITFTASQVDIFPTILDLLKFKTPFATISNSLFDKPAERFALNLNGYLYTLVTDHGYVQFDQRSIYNKYGEFDFPLLINLDKSLSYLFTTNRIYP